MDSSKVYLVQTDTTVGFLSSNSTKLSHIKQRDFRQKILQETDSFHTLKKHTRVPNKFKKYIRRSKNTTFIYPNKNSFRVISQDSDHYNFIKKFNIIYSTSANKTKQPYDERFALDSSDVVVYTKDNFFISSGSKIVKVTNFKLKRIR
jgi:tRNA A37 threonylcarbamoyladenosine synthetase subunit TsaC/SUA5/YrdC